MPKILLSLLIFTVYSMPAHSAPYAPGEYASFHVSTESSALGEEYSLSITEIRDSFTFGIEQSWRAGKRPPLRSWLSAAQMEASLIGFTPDHAQKYFSECSSFAGKLGVIDTPAGAFLACTVYFIDDPRSGYSISPAVPFGIVRRVDGPDEQGAYRTYTLRSFNFGP